MWPTLDCLILFAGSVVTAILGVVVYHRAPDRVWNRLFTIHALAVSAWIMLNYLIQTATTTLDASLALRLCHPVVAVVVCTCVDLFWTFPERAELAPQSHRTVLYTVGLLFATAGAFPNLYTSIELAQGTVIVEYGPPFVAFGWFTVVMLGYADYMLIAKLPRLTGLQRVQVSYVLTGMVLSQVIAVVTMIIMPLVFNNTYYSRWGSAAYILMVAFMAYAIAKHNIVRPLTAFYRASVYVVTGALLALLVVGVLNAAGHVVAGSHMSPSVLYMLCGVGVGILIVWFHRHIRHTLDGALPYVRAAHAANDASDGILRTLDADELHSFLANTIAGILRPSHVSVFSTDGASGNYVCRSENSSFRQSSNDMPYEISADSSLIRAVTENHDLLERSHIRRFQSLDDATPILEEMARFDAEIVAPIFWEKHLIGLVIIGENVSGEMYAPEELEMLRNMLPQVSLATRNAQLFDEMVQMKEYNENLLRRMKSGVIAVDTDQRVVLVNPAAEELLGITAASVIGRNLDVLPHDIAGCLAEALTGDVERAEHSFRVSRPHGEEVSVACSTSGWGGNPLSQQAAMAVISDLSLVEELERERGQAEHLAMIRVLSAGMAHEIRNPLVAIRTFAELLPTRWADPEFRDDFLATTQEEISRIDRLLNDLMMLSKPADAVVEEVDVNAVCSAVTRAMSAHAEARGVALITDLHANDRHPVGDESRLHQAIINLVANAVDAEPEDGLVRVTTHEEFDSEQAAVVVIGVRNANSHISQAQIGEIFKPFYSRRAGGTGLGLAICETIIEEHNGTIEVHSDRSTGTEFIVRLPLRSENEEA
jgi:PAS domain S-box-containing protein